MQMGLRRLPMSDLVAGGGILLVGILCIGRELTHSTMVQI